MVARQNDRIRTTTIPCKANKAILFFRKALGNNTSLKKCAKAVEQNKIKTDWEKADQKL